MGMYAEIEPTKVEGMIPLRTIRSDFFEFDEKNYRLIGRRTRKVYTLGDPVRIRVKSANLDQVLLDYELVEPEHETAEEPGGAPYGPPPPPPARPPRKPAAPRKPSTKRTTKKK